MLCRLIAHDPRLRLRVGVDAPQVRPEQSISLGRRPNTFVQLQKYQSIIGYLLEDRGLFHGRFPLHANFGRKEVVTKFSSSHT